jgi:hypothetical protein
MHPAVRYEVLEKAACSHSGEEYTCGRDEFVGEHPKLLRRLTQ